MKRPDLWVIAGPNGAGKSTLYRRVLAGKLPIVNPDDIAASIDLDRRNTPAIQLAAGRQALAQHQAHLASRRSFGIETTLTGHTALELMQRAQQAGYRINLVYVGLDDVALSAMRVARRVATGGHDVPPAAVARRYAISMANLAKAMPIADRAWVFDNSGEGRRLLLSRRADQVRHVAKNLPTWAERAIPAGMRRKALDRDQGRD